MANQPEPQQPFVCPWCREHVASWDVPCPSCKRLPDWAKWMAEQDAAAELLKPPGWQGDPTHEPLNTQEAIGGYLRRAMAGLLCCPSRGELWLAKANELYANVFRALEALRLATPEQFPKTTDPDEAERQLRNLLQWFARQQGVFPTATPRSTLKIPPDDLPGLCDWFAERLRQFQDAPYCTPDYWRDVETREHEPRLAAARIGLAQGTIDVAQRWLDRHGATSGPEWPRMVRPEVGDDWPKQTHVDHAEAELSTMLRFLRGLAAGSSAGSNGMPKDPPQNPPVTRGRREADHPTPKRSTEQGEARAKLIAALTKHHKYDNGSCLNTAPIGNNALARLAGVAKRTASAFFAEQFQGHGKYRACCADTSRLVAAMKLLNQDFAPHHLYGASPECERD